MRKIFSVLSLAVVTALAVYSLTSAKVYVGPEHIELPQSNGEVFVRNLIGDVRGFARDPITRLSYSWVPIRSLAISSSEGALFSAIAVDALLRMEPEVAYKIAQRARERAMKSTDRPLRYPLETIHDEFLFR